MRILRTSRDIRTGHRVKRSVQPRSDGARLQHLHRLTCEKQRLLVELDMWRHKQQQAETRLRELEGQMEELIGQIELLRSPGQPRAPESVSIEY